MCIRDRAQGSRMEWAASLPFEVPTVEENPDYEYLLWIGCAGAFNPDAQKTCLLYTSRCV